MAKKIKLGDYNRLRIVKKVDFGLYLDGGNEGRNSIGAQIANTMNQMHGVGVWES